MTCRSAPRSNAVARVKTRKMGAMWGSWLIGLGALALIAAPAFAENHEKIIVAHGITNFGELKHPANMPYLPYVNPNAPKGGEISQWAQGNFDSFNRYTRKGVAGSLAEMPQENILIGAADDAYGSYCYMCTTMEYPEDRSWVIFNLRDDVTFSDGRPMTAEDIKFSYELVLEQGITEFVAAVKGIVSEVEILEPYKIKFTFTETSPFRDRITFAGGTSVFSKSWFEETGARLDDSTLVPFLGTGPYMVESFDVGRQIIYGRNPNFWGADHPFNIGRNNFDTIRIEYFADSSAALEGFKAGEYTFRNENSSKDWATGYEFPGVTDGYVIKTELPDGTIGTAQSFIFNLDKPIWQDKKVREAIRLMFNFEWSNETLFFGLYERVNSFWENSALEATGVPTPEEAAILKPLVDEGLLDASILTDEAVMAPTSGTRPLDRGNLRKASAILDEAGWEVGDDGFRRKDGQKLEAVILMFSPAFDRIVNPYIENLLRLGVDARLERVDVSQYVDRRRSGDFDMTTHSFTMGFEPGTGIRQWYSSTTADDSSRNLMRLRDPAIDSLVETVIAAESLEELTTATHALDRALRAEGFWVQQWFKDVHTVAYYDMYRYPEPLPPFALGELSFWWYDAEAHEALRAAGALN